MGAVSKAIKKIIPREIRPIVPIAASMFGAPFLGSALQGTGIMSALGPIGSRALTSGLTSAATDLITRGKVDPRSLIASTALGAGGEYLKGPANVIGPPTKFQSFKQSLGRTLAPDIEDIGTIQDVTRPLTIASSIGGGIAAADEADRLKDEYERGVAADKETRRATLIRYMELAGYSQQEIDDALSDYGYANGGRAGFAEGGSSLFEKASDMNRLALEIKLIDLGYGGFGGKDLEEMTDEEIIQLYKEATSKANGGLMGTRIGYEMGGMSDLGKLFSKITGKKPTEESLMNKKAQYAKEIENQMIRELNEDYPAMETLIQIRNEANRQADMALNDYMKSLGMEPFNPPEGSMSDKLINQIMEPRKEGRVEEANGGRIKKSIGGLAFAYDDYLRQADELGLSGDPMSFEEFTDTWLELQSDLGNSEKYKKGGRAGYAEGGSSTEQQKRENYFDLKRDEFMSLSEYLLSPISDADLRKNKAKGGMMNLKMGGMPMEMDLRGGGFVPIGRKEKADDVPARLSKNEFVFTADAVRAAGGGSVNKGAQRMYDLMNKLEARV